MDFEQPLFGFELEIYYCSIWFMRGLWRKSASPDEAAKLAISSRRNALVADENAAILDRVRDFRSVSDRPNAVVDQVRAELTAVEDDELDRLLAGGPASTDCGRNYWPRARRTRRRSQPVRSDARTRTA